MPRSFKKRIPASARIEGATAALFDCAEFDESECEALRRMVLAVRPVPVIVLLSFPRIEDQRRALTAGTFAAISKPLLVEDLMDEINAGSHSEHGNQRH